MKSHERSAPDTYQWLSTNIPCHKIYAQSETLIIHNSLIFIILWVLPYMIPYHSPNILQQEAITRHDLFIKYAKVTVELNLKKCTCSSLVCAAFFALCSPFALSKATVALVQLFKRLRCCISSWKLNLFVSPIPCTYMEMVKYTKYSLVT